VGKPISRAVQDEAESNDGDGIIKDIDGCHVCVFSLLELRFYRTNK
jgi:hypothetical protein